jgi:hypothetical protein
MLIDSNCARISVMEGSSGTVSTTGISVGTGSVKVGVDSLGASEDGTLVDSARIVEVAKVDSAPPQPANNKHPVINRQAFK